MFTSRWLLCSRPVTNWPVTGAQVTARYPRSNLRQRGILCVGLDDADKLKSIAGICGVWVEEATEITANDFAQLELRVRGLRIWMDARCVLSVEDYQMVQEEPDGTKRKVATLDVATGVRCQRYGHCSDANDYFLCVVLAEEYRKFFRMGGQPAGRVGN